METLRLDLDRKTPADPAANTSRDDPKANEPAERGDWIGRILTTLRKRSEPSVKDAQVLDRESILGSCDQTFRRRTLDLQIVDISWPVIGDHDGVHLSRTVALQARGQPRPT